MAYQLSEYDRMMAQKLADQKYQGASSATTTPQPKGAPEDLLSFGLGFLPGGSIVDKFRRGADISGGDVATEVGLSLIPFGLGKIGRGIKGGINAAKNGAKVASASARDAGKAGMSTFKAGQYGNVLDEAFGAGKATKSAMTNTKNKSILDTLTETKSNISVNDAKLADKGYKASQNSRKYNQKSIDGINGQMDQLDPYGVARKTDPLEMAATQAPEELGLWDKAANSLTHPSTIAPVSTLDRASEQKFLNETVRNIPGMRGSAKAKFNNVEKAINQKSDDVDKMLKGVTTRTPKTDVNDRIINVMGDLETNGDKNKFRRIHNNIVNERFGGKLPDEMSLEDINNYRRGLNSVATRAYKTVSAGNAPNAVDDAILSLKDEMTKMIDDLVPSNISGQVKQTNREISSLIKGIPDFKRAAEEEIRPLGMHIPILSQLMPQMAQGGADRLGRTMTNPAGKFLLQQAGVRGVANTFAPTEASAMGVPGKNTGVNPLEMAAEGAMGSDTSALMGGGGSDEETALLNQLMGGGEAETAPESMYTLENLFKDVAAQPDQASVLIKLYELANEGTSESATERTAAAKQRKMIGVMDQLEQGFAEFGGGAGPAGWLSRGANALTGGGANPELARYDALRKGVTSQLAKSLGEAGVLTNQDIQRALDLIPSITDSPESGQLKLEQLRQIVEM